MLIWALIIIAHELVIIVYLMVIVLRQGRWIRRMQAELDRRAAAPRQQPGPAVVQDEASGAKPAGAEQTKESGASTVAPSAEPDWQTAPPPVRTEQKA